MEFCRTNCKEVCGLIVLLPFQDLVSHVRDQDLPPNNAVQIDICVVIAWEKVGCIPLPVAFPKQHHAALKLNLKFGSHV